MQIDELQERLQTLLTENETLTAKAEAEKRDFTVEEQTQFDNNLSAWEAAKENIDRLNRLAAQQKLMIQGKGRKTEADPPQKLAQNEDGQPQVKRPDGRKTYIEVDPYSTSKNGGFRTLGEMAFHVRLACLRGGQIDPRLDRLAAATTYGSEGVGSDGGFAVPPDFRTEIMQKVLGESSLLRLCDQITCSGNTFTAPFDETTPWQTTGGIQAYWDGEASTATQSKPLLEQKTVKLNKIRALVPMTEELLEDASAMDAYLRRKAPEKIDFKISLAILQGTGVGQPAGILTAPCTVSVAKVGSQVADTLVGINIINMYARMYAPLRSSATWVFHQDVEPQLWTLMKVGKLDTGAADTGWGSLLTNVITYGPDGSMRIFGRPVIFSQACETLGDKGDAFFIHFPSYLALLKSGANPRTETSMHLWFDQDLVAFKFVLRVGGIPWWASSVAARDGSNTYSCFVTLDERA